MPDDTEDVAPRADGTLKGLEDLSEKPRITEEKRRPFSFRRSYGFVRDRIWRALNLNQSVMPVRIIIFIARVIAVSVDLPIRWLMSFLDTVAGDRGYLTVGSIIGGHLIVFGLIDAKHQQESARAS
jgi:hypothetical protein